MNYKKEFTPGEWFQSHRPIPNNEERMYSTQVYTEDGETIASLAWYPKPKAKGIIEGKHFLVTGSYREANAKLIAAAPDLLNACILALKSTHDLKVRSKLEYAINKALKY